MEFKALLANLYQESRDATLTLSGCPSRDSPPPSPIFGTDKRSSDGKAIRSFFFRLYMPGAISSTAGRPQGNLQAQPICFLGPVLCTQTSPMSRSVLPHSGRMSVGSCRHQTNCCLPAWTPALLKAPASSLEPLVVRFVGSASLRHTFSLATRAQQSSRSRTWRPVSQIPPLQATVSQNLLGGATDDPRKETEDT